IVTGAAELIVELCPAGRRRRVRLRAPRDERYEQQRGQGLRAPERGTRHREPPSLLDSSRWRLSVEGGAGGKRLHLRVGRADARGHERVVAHAIAGNRLAGALGRRLVPEEIWSSEN